MYPCIHAHPCIPLPRGCTKAGCPGSTDPPRAHALTLHSIAEAVAPGGLGARLPGQTQKGGSSLHHAKIQHGASTAFWRHTEAGMSPQPHACTHPSLWTWTLTGPCSAGHGLADAVGVLGGDSDQVLCPNAQSPQHSVCLPRPHAYLGRNNVTPSSSPGHTWSHQEPQEL